jgi:hypothetical protein
VTSVSTLSTAHQPLKTPRERAADSFHAALSAVLTAGLDDALAAGDHPRAVSFINRGFAEGDPELGCDLLCRAIAAVGPARTWTVQLAPRPSYRGPVGGGEPPVKQLASGGREFAQIRPRQA